MADKKKTKEELRKERPPEVWGNDLRDRDPRDVDTSPGSHYDQLFGPDTEPGKLAEKLKQKPKK